MLYCTFSVTFQFLKSDHEVLHCKKERETTHLMYNIAEGFMEQVNF